MNLSSRAILLASLCSWLAPLAIADEPEVSSEVDRPFCYFLPPSDELGFKDCPEGFQVTWDCAFASAFGEMVLLAGDPPRPVDVRVRTLASGHLPVLELSLDRDGVRLRGRAFATCLELDPRGALVLFVRLTASNPGSEPVPVTLGAAFQGRGEKGREPLGCPPWYQGLFLDQAGWEKGRIASDHQGGLSRGEHIVLETRAQTNLSLVALAREDGSRVLYQGSLAPGESTSVWVKMPYVPIHASRQPVRDGFARASYPDMLTRTVSFWNDILDDAALFEVPERKATETLRASLVYDLMARDIEEDGTLVQKVSDIHYDAFWVRDGAFIVRAYDLLGLHEIAEETIEHFLVHDEEGDVVSFRSHQPDSWGQSLWTVGAHYRITGDVEFARRVWPAIPPHLEAFEKACASDPLGIWPVSGPYDNEAIDGHYVGHNFWALLGLEEAAHLATATFHVEEAARISAMRRQYEATFLELLREVTLQTGGIIPPGMDDPLLGCDWANASAGVFPFRVLPARHALVTSTLEAMREYKYREGIMTYGANAFAVKEAERTGRTLDPGKLHHYETFYVTQASLARGEQRDVVEDFSSILVHTGSTHSGFEWGIEPWGDRDAGGNLPPHGWFAARYIALLRNMLVREEGMDLHLLSALSPAWIRTGEKIRVVDAPTDFGEVSFSLQTTEEGADLRLRCRFRVAPRKIRIHVPWFVDLDSARVDGLPPVQVTSGIDVSPEAREIHLAWRRRSPEPRLDYREGVRLFLDKWGNPRPERDVATIFPRLSRPVVVRADRLFLDEGVLILAPPDGRGSVLFSAPGIPPGPDSYESPLTFDKSTTVTAVTLQEDRMSAPVTVTLEKATPLAAVEVGKIARGIRLSLHAGAFSRLPSDEDLSDPVLSTEERLRIPGGAPEDDYLCVYQGFLHVPRKGIWTFFLTSDDGSRLSVGDRMVVDNDGLHARRQESGQVALCEGWHPLRVEFFERGGAASLTVEMEGPGMERQEVPAEHLYHCVSR